MFLSSLPREATLSIPKQMLIRLIFNLQYIHLAVHFAPCEVTHSSPNCSWHCTLHTPAAELFWAAKMGHARRVQVEGARLGQELRENITAKTTARSASAGK